MTTKFLIIMLLVMTMLPTEAVQGSVRITADSWLRNRFVKTDGDSVTYNADLNGLYVWSFGMWNQGGGPIVKPSFSILTRYASTRFTYVSPNTARITNDGGRTRLLWTGFSNIQPETWDASVYIETNIAVNFTAGFDSARIVSPLEITTPTATQTTTVIVTPHRVFDRLIVEVDADDTGLTRATYLSSSPIVSPADRNAGYYFENGRTYAYWELPTHRPTKISVQFAVQNRNYPNVVFFKPRVQVGAEQARWGSLSSGSSVKMTNPIIGELTYSASGSYDWDYGTRQRNEIVYEHWLAFLRTVLVYVGKTNQTQVTNLIQGNTTTSAVSIIDTRNVVMLIGTSLASVILIALLIRRKRPVEDKTRVYLLEI